MSKSLKAMIVTSVAIAMLSMGYVATARAGCIPAEGFNKIGLIDDPITGFWRAKFIAQGNPEIPDGTQIDDALVQWHADGTEIMNSSRVPATGNFCLGVWQKSGQTYQLNHFAKAFNPDGTYLGPAQIRESVKLNLKANQYQGSFVLDQYDTQGNVLAHITGAINASRLTVKSGIGDVS